MSKYAWVTLATNDSYSLGALVLAHSLKRASTMHELAVLITPGVSETMQTKLKQTFHTVKEVNVMDSHDATHLALLARPELGITFTKIHCWQLVNYEKCVFLDADTMVLQNCDELFEREELSAAPDVGWPDCFNSGVFVYRPNLDTFANLTKFALEKGSFDGGDQGLLNSFFSDWAHKDISKHLPFIYNTCSTATYSYLPAFKRFAHQVKILHFIGKLKPWLINFNSENKFAYVPEDLSHMGEFLQLWWQIFCDKVHPNLNEQMSGLAGALAKLKLGEPRTPEQEDYEQHMRRQCWESGNIDYTGRDSFDNIWRKISQTLESGPKPAVSTQTASEKPAKRLTSAKIEDGKVEYDKETNSTTVYKLIPGGYEMHITTPQPNGTNKTQTKTFYDPVPVTEEELLKQKKTEKNKKTDDNTTVTVKKVPGGHEEITTITNADGTKSIQTKTIYDAEEVEETETVETREQKTGQKNVNVKKQAQNKPQPQTKTLQKVDTEEQTSTHEFNIKSEKKVEETRRYSETTEIKGKSTKTTKKNTIENQNVLALEDTDSSSKKKKTKSPKKSQEVVEERVDENTTVIKTRVPGGTEYTYKKTLEDGTTEISTKTVYEQLNIEMTEEEIEEYEMQKKQAEKLKKTKKTKLPSEAGTKKIIPSENPGDVTTLETIQIEGGTEYHYTTVRADGTVKKSSKTVYDPVPVEGDEDEEEIIEEYEEEVIEPGEPITRTITTTKTLPLKDIDEKKLGQDAPVSKGKKKGIKSQ